jgi:two-component system NtrC family sensor kinase
VQAAKLAAVGEMAAGIAHELNNPLTTVTGFSELLLDGMPAEAPNRADLELVLKEARRAGEVVRQLLDFARQGDRIRAHADFNQIVQDVIALTSHLIRTSGVALSLQLGPGLPEVLVDRNQLQQVILNLIHNSLQAMPAGGDLEIGTRTEARDGRPWLLCWVRDTGMGIPPQAKDRIFEPFFTTRSDRGGTGLGLSVSYGIVTDHGGTIQVESEIGQGTTFSVWLPA